jgi:hypothetical protein
MLTLKIQDYWSYWQLLAELCHFYESWTQFHQYQLINMQAYYVLDEILIAGELQESSKKNVARLIAAQVSSLLASINSLCSHD